MSPHPAPDNRLCRQTLNLLDFYGRGEPSRPCCLSVFRAMPSRSRANRRLHRTLGKIRRRGAIQLRDVPHPALRHFLIGGPHFSLVGEQRDWLPQLGTSPREWGWLPGALIKRPSCGARPDGACHRRGRRPLARGVKIPHRRFFGPCWHRGRQTGVAVRPAGGP